MTPEQWDIVSRVFNEAVALRPNERKSFINQACHGNVTLIAEVESLLSAHESAGDFINEPIVEDLVSDISEMPTLTGKYIGHYLIEKSIGRGGMGDVYLATDTRLDRLVALKRLPHRLAADPQFVKRFRTEAKAAATLHHPNVATIFSVEDDETGPLITMEFVEGRTLDSIVPPEGMDVERFLNIFIQVSEALRHAHEKGVTHRDIKPRNIMISTDGTAKILDFGLAQIAEDNQAAGRGGSLITQPGQIIGTPSYMSPEQAQGKNVDHRTDIFSLGVVMYEAITGKRPFTGDNNAEVISNLLRTDPEQVSSLRPSVPGLISRLIGRCMEKRPSDRPQSMQEVRTILDEVRSIVRAGTTTGSFAHRLYRESTSLGFWMRLAPVGLVVVLATAGWFYFSGPPASSPFSIDTMSIRKLSQSNNVALSVISPDGRSVAYVTYEDDDGRALWLRRISDANAIKIVPSQQVHYWDIAFSNDNEFIYFITAPRFGIHGTLFRVPALGGQPRKITEKVNHLGNTSSDGKRVLFVRYGDPSPATSVNVVDSKLISANSEDGTDEQVIKRLEGESVIRKARYSSDGNSIFYIKRELKDVEYWSIVMLDPDTGTERELIRKKELIEAFAVLQDGSGLLINAVDGSSNRPQLFYVTVPRGEVTRITNDLNGYIGVSVDNEGRNIVAVQRSDESRVWVGDASNFAGMTPITRGPFAFQVVDWTPDGRLVFDVLRNDRLSIWIADPDGKNAVQLTPQDSDNYTPRVSGDGRYIVFTSRRAGYNQVWRMNVDGSDPALLANAPGITQAPILAADGTTVVFRWYQEDSPPMGQVSVSGGPVTGLDYLPPAFTYSWAMSPDGKYIAYTQGGGTNDPMKVIVRHADSTAPETLLNIRPVWIFKWMPDSRRIFYQESQLGENLASKVFVIGPGQVEPDLLLTTEPDSIRDLTFSRDSKKFAAVRVNILTDAVMLTNSPNGSGN
jgi:serine/threonine protein kinase